MSYSYLLFDLDDTLYTNDSGLFDEVRQRIVQWVAQTLEVSVEEAGTLRDRYYRTYGTTMGGLLEHHPHVDIDAYLHAVHQVNVDRYLTPAPELDAMLARLHTHKAIFTNAIAEWAERILRRLNVRKHFEQIIDVRAVGYVSKPKPLAYERALNLLGVPGDACVLIDDQHANLERAAAFGMRTVLVGEAPTPRNDVDYVVPEILQAEPVLQKILEGKA